MRGRWFVVVALGATLGGCGEAAVDTAPTVEAPPLTYTETREVCAHRTPLRMPLYGDFHVHTRFSFDARAYDNLLTPDDAYAFAQGEAVMLPPLDGDGRGTRVAQLARPLDFVGVTDHAEFLGEIYLCDTPGSARYDAPTCVQYRDPEENGAYEFGMLLAHTDPSRFDDLCDEEGGEPCASAASLRWQEMQDMAEANYDRTEACTFTTFASYEYTNTREVSNLHRNVVFRNAHVPELPVTLFDATEPLALWQQLDTVCKKAGTGCDVIVLPHNSNLSNGQLFTPTYPEGASLEEQRAVATLRAEMEPLVEIFQHKGDSECRNGLAYINGAEDPHCEFEKLRVKNAEDCMDEPGVGGMRLWGCVHRLDFVRNVLKEGLVEAERLGVNPYALGVIGSTDTHNGTPGNVASHGFAGHVGSADDTADERLGPGNITHDGLINNPGGLVGVWAVENSRDAIFDAMHRKETFATSGPRIPVRFFGGWGYDKEVCGQDHEAMLTAAYNEGAAMGGALATGPESGGAPTFIVQAFADPGAAEAPGAPLAQVQIVKGWFGSGGQGHEQVFTVSETGADASVDPATCEATGEGWDEVCVTWTDPSFDPDQRAFYYARVLEIPTCRWSAWECLNYPPGEEHEGCFSTRVPKTVQHRAWSSPIWYTPGG